MSPAPTPVEITRLLAEWNQGDAAAFERLIPLVYDELRQLARRQLRNEKPGATLQPTALVNEFYLRLIGHRNADWENRAHFFGAAAKLMRRIIVDYSRKRRALKRGGNAIRMELPDLPSRSAEDDLETLDEALEQLAEHDLFAARIVELHYFLGLTIQETAEATGVSTATVKREWNFAKTWLAKHISCPVRR